MSNLILATKKESYKERFEVENKSSLKNEPSTRKDENSIKSDIMPNLKRVKSDSSTESKIYEMAQEIANSRKIKTFKGLSSSNENFFKIFFFNDSMEMSDSKNEDSSKSQSPNSLLSGNFNRPKNKQLAKSDSEYLIIKIFPETRHVRVEDSNVKKSLESRIGDVDMSGEGSVMSVETQIKSLVGHWLELSNTNIELRHCDKLF